MCAPQVLAARGVTQLVGESTPAAHLMLAVASLEFPDLSRLLCSLESTWQSCPVALHNAPSSLLVPDVTMHVCNAAGRLVQQQAPGPVVPHPAGHNGLKAPSKQEQPMPLNLMTLAYRRTRHIDCVMSPALRRPMVERAMQLEAK